MQQVAIIQRVLPYYRVAFFRSLAAALQSHGIQLTVYYGREKTNTVPKTTTVTEAWAAEITNRYISCLGQEMVWQSCPKIIGIFDLVIIEQALRFPLNLFLHLTRTNTDTALAYWGHGKNYQARKRRRFAEYVKRKLVGAVDWWFAYTASSALEVVSAGFPRDRVTIVNNSIDTSSFRLAVSVVTIDMVELEKKRLGLEGVCVGLYCGGMYPEKRLHFLIKSLELIKEQVPSFEFIFIGDGPEQAIVQSAAERLPWIRYLGPIHGDARAIYFRMSNLLLMPGLVGLVIVDSFVAEVPLATTDIDYHSPEIAYLHDGVNGIVTKDDVCEYASSVARLLRDPSKMQMLQAGCGASGEKYSLNSMVENFAAGVLGCLDRKILR